MSLIELFIELIFDVFAVALGITLVIRKNGNLQRFYWGIISIAIGFFLMWENFDWIFIVSRNSNYEYREILNVEKMLKWFAPASIISLFPLASLRPGYINTKRLIIYFLPFLVILTITVCYLSSNQTITEIHTLNDIFLNINKFDIKLRILIFIFSVIIPVVYFFYPFIRYSSSRKASFYMYLFLEFSLALSCIYIFFTLYINTFFFNAFGILSVIFAITFSVLYLYSENPLSIHLENINQEASATNKPSPLFFEIDKFMKEQKAFVESDYSIKDVADALGIDEHEIIQSIKSGGFTGFREYLNITRLGYFKTLVSENPDKTIKEIMFACGFNSRTTFYRVFSEQYGISPLQYINNLKIKQ